MASCWGLYNGLSRNQTQSLITDFVLRTAELSTMGNRNDNREIISKNDEQNNSGDSSDIAVICKRMRLLSESDDE